ncbi:2-hydroxyacid dehydrogenase [Schizosaccharomyces pombe]|uniref:2-hydroxyacid dehydrogenase homolog 2 n=1 Tax=Schizosaccharomyces pombe (strain 972 / ATCC 24843) TaxID=284812 RepID=DDH2_SCHPO|nr:putative hydroxyacid dehydrogenase [Schizosaccharomyces pombe]Q9P7Q1.1 RecName: Full=2-hydroxyacid dehydrogenase homolog 2 [Schizosaccharomyces pombe 972h-]CAB75866.1 hydroxyacid dehydrogenase (predicted) [Schizosaccharomyces pombe]|eukprot:NP_595020.1 putative hydroxyacid dehydrogenase [Schizosaccharomyces pombe]
MRVVLFSSQSYDRGPFEEANKTFNHEIIYHNFSLNKDTVSLAGKAQVVCVFVNDQVDADTLKALAENGVKLVALRCGGYNNVNLKAASEYKITVVHVPSYSPFAVSEFTVGLLLSLNRKIHRAYVRVREDDFNIVGLLGCDIHGKTVGVIGTGKIGSNVAKCFKMGFGCDVLAYDINPDKKLENYGVQFVEQNEVLKKADFLCLHCPLTPSTTHIVNSDSLALMKKGVTIVNTSRGGLIDTKALVDAIDSGQVGGCAIDVYEGERNLFYKDLSNEVIKDSTFQRLVNFPNVLVTSHQAFFTTEALCSIAHTTLKSASDFYTNSLDESVIANK